MLTILLLICYVALFFRRSQISTLILLQHLDLEDNQLIRPIPPRVSVDDVLPLGLLYFIELCTHTLGFAIIGIL